MNYLSFVMQKLSSLCSPLLTSLPYALGSAGRPFIILPFAFNSLFIDEILRAAHTQLYKGLIKHQLVSIVHVDEAPSISEDKFSDLLHVRVMSFVVKYCNAINCLANINMCVCYSDETSQKFANKLGFFLLFLITFFFFEKRSVKS